MALTIRRYLTEAGADVFGEWTIGLKDSAIRAMIAARIARLAAGNFGDCKRLKNGLSELRIDRGPGFRVYFAMIDRSTVLLLCGGDKSSQARDIDRAVRFWKDFRSRNGKP